MRRTFRSDLRPRCTAPAGAAAAGCLRRRRPLSPLVCMQLGLRAVLQPHPPPKHVALGRGAPSDANPPSLGGGLQSCAWAAPWRPAADDWSDQAGLGPSPPGNPAGCTGPVPGAPGAGDPTSAAQWRCKGTDGVLDDLTSRRVRSPAAHSLAFSTVPLALISARILPLDLHCMLKPERPRARALDSSAAGSIFPRTCSISRIVAAFAHSHAPHHGGALGAGGAGGGGGAPPPAGLLRRPLVGRAP